MQRQVRISEMLDMECPLPFIPEKKLSAQALTAVEEKQA